VAPPGWPGYAPPGTYPAYPPGYYPSPYYYQPLLPPAALPYEDGQSVPRGYRVRARPVKSLLIAGSITFGTTYLASVLAGATVLANGLQDGKAASPLFAPVVGPFITIGTAGSGGATPLLVLDGLVQLGGIVMLICGAAIEEKYLQRYAAGEASPLEALVHPDVILGPRYGGLRWTL
jgi:hypothetical protein